MEIYGYTMHTGLNFHNNLVYFSLMADSDLLLSGGFSSSNVAKELKSPQISQCDHIGALWYLVSNFLTNLSPNVITKIGDDYRI